MSLPTEPGLREAFGDVPGVEIVDWDLDGPAPRNKIDMVVVPYWDHARVLKNLEGHSVRLVQWQSIGFNGVDKYLPEGYPLANAATVHETSTAELALALTLAAQRGLPKFVRNATSGSWNLESFPSLADRRVLIAGYGGVGKAIEARLQGFEVNITRLARTARQEKNLAGEMVRVHGFDELHALLPHAEIVILGLPLNAETRSYLGAEELALLPDDALVVNVGRGPSIDTDALVAETSSGRLRAALDVTDPEPLPADHPLWQLPNVLITPHAGGDSSARIPRLISLLKRQVEHLRAGRTPENIVLGEVDLGA